jgi:hypothetical protein
MLNNQVSESQVAKRTFHEWKHSWNLFSGCLLFHVSFILFSQKVVSTWQPIPCPKQFLRKIRIALTWSDNCPWVFTWVIEDYSNQRLETEGKCFLWLKFALLRRLRTTVEKSFVQYFSHTCLMNCLDCMFSFSTNLFLWLHSLFFLFLFFSSLR